MASPLVQVALKQCQSSIGKYAIVTVKSEPVNALNLKLWSALLQTLDGLEKQDDVRGVILQSGLQRDLFTAGNDLMELYVPKTTPEQFERFWLTQTTFLARWYRSPLVTLAAVRGHAPAGGCAIALCSDYRLMTSIKATPKARIGLNEVALGILVPKVWVHADDWEMDTHASQMWGQLFSKIVGVGGRSEKLLMFGKMVKPEEALKLGMVDELVDDKELLLEKAEERMNQLLMPPDAGRQMTKYLLRDAFSKEWEEYGKEEAKLAWGALSRPDVIEALGMVLQTLKKSKL